MSLARRIAAVEARRVGPAAPCGCRIVIVDQPAGEPLPPMPPRAHPGACSRVRRLVAVRPEARP